ncbi:hypothetical protein [Lentibacter sp.]|uniref:hypothetical protein n=1 Tax=Lentibacter sp. TaxID=2024994 RepID=UPI003F699119
MTLFFKMTSLVALLGVAACSSGEPPRAVSTVSSAQTMTLLPPKISKMTDSEIQITYPQASIGFDAGCDAFSPMQSRLNQCAKLPENVKTIATDHCTRFGKEAIFLGNKTNFLHMTVSQFSCE